MHAGCGILSIIFSNALTVFWLCMGCRRPLEGVLEKFGALDILNLLPGSKHKEKGHVIHSTTSYRRHVDKKRNLPQTDTV